jgi:hypothetical protein
MPCTAMFPALNQLCIPGGWNKDSKLSSIRPLRTRTKPTAQGLAGELLAVSKSIAVKSRDILNSLPLATDG